jgi:putative ABC transport system substrate-binding protein
MMIRRRELITLLGGGAAAWPLAAHAQQAAPVVGFVRATSSEASVNLVEAFRQGLRETGFVEGGNIAIEYRWSENGFEKLPALAADLVRRQCAAIIAGGNSPIAAVKAATQAIPIVFVTGEDPVALGFVPSLSRPVGNVTGVTFYSGALAGKQLELLREVAPTAAVIGMLVDPTNAASEAQIRDARAAAQALGQQIHIQNASTEGDFDRAFASFAQSGAGALLVAGGALFTGQRDKLAKLAAGQSLPAVYDLRDFVAAGGLMSYGSSITDAYRQAGIYAGRILRGAKPSDLPVLLPTKFEFVLNLKTAKALGLTISREMLLIADEVIE